MGVDQPVGRRPSEWTRKWGRGGENGPKSTHDANDICTICRENLRFLSPPKPTRRTGRVGGGWGRRPHQPEQRPPCVRVWTRGRSGGTVTTSAATLPSAIRPPTPTQRSAAAKLPAR